MQSQQLSRGVQVKLSQTMFGGDCQVLAWCFGFGLVLFCLVLALVLVWFCSVVFCSAVLVGLVRRLFGHIDQMLFALMTHTSGKIGWLGAFLGAFNWCTHTGLVRH